MKALYLIAGVVGTIGAIVVGFSGVPGADYCAAIAGVLSLSMMAIGAVLE